MQRYDFFFNNQHFISEPPKAHPSDSSNTSNTRATSTTRDTSTTSNPHPRPKENKKRESQNPETPYKRLAATYFPTNRRSIIGDAGLNFSVRNGKRCSPAPRPPRIVLPALKAGDHWHKTYKSAHGKPSGY